MKRTGLYLSSALLAVILIAGYHLSFPIRPNDPQLEDHIADWANRGYSTPISRDVRISDGVEMGNLAYAAIELDQELGYVLLKKGMTGRYRIDHLSHGSGAFRNGIIAVDDQKHLLFMGRNASGKIAKTTFTTDERGEYTLDIPQQNVFFVYTRVDNDTQTGPISLDQINVYSQEGENITAMTELGGGGIQ